MEINKITFTNIMLDNLNNSISDNGKVDLEHFIELTNKTYKAINYSRCCTELSHDFKKGDDVWITSKKLVTIADFTECGKRVQVEDGCDYYLVDIDEITKVG